MLGLVLEDALPSAGLLLQADLHNGRVAFLQGVQQVAAQPFASGRS